MSGCPSSTSRCTRARMNAGQAGVLSHPARLRVDSSSRRNSVVPAASMLAWQRTRFSSAETGSAPCSCGSGSSSTAAMAWSRARCPSPRAPTRTAVGQCARKYNTGCSNTPGTRASVLPASDTKRLAVRRAERATASTRTASPASLRSGRPSTASASSSCFACRSCFPASPIHVHIGIFISPCRAMCEQKVAAW